MRVYICIYACLLQHLQHDQLLGAVHLDVAALVAIKVDHLLILIVPKVELGWVGLGLWFGGGVNEGTLASGGKVAG